MWRRLNNFLLLLTPPWVLCMVILPIVVKIADTSTLGVENVPLSLVPGWCIEAGAEDFGYFDL